MDKKLNDFVITGLEVSGFKSYETPTTFTFGEVTTVTGGNGRGKTSIADAIAFAVTGLPYFGKRGIDRLYNENNPDLYVRLSLVDDSGAPHELIRTRRKDRMTISYDGYEVRQLDITDRFGERDVFLSIFNPLYFIEELGESGKNLLERYMPTISHEAVLAELSESTRAALQNVELISPEGFLKARREDIRNLEENIIYLNGQKDLAQSQDSGKMLQEAEAQLQSLDQELHELEARQFDGLDTEAMQTELVDLGARYDELSRDIRADAEAQREVLHALRSKALERKNEQYQPKYAQAIADIQAASKILGEQYHRDLNSFNTFVPGCSCPTCHRPITAEHLPQIQLALKQSGADLLAKGHENKAKLQELQELEEKAYATFEQFKASDLERLNAEIAAKEKECDGNDAAVTLDTIRSHIQDLTSALEFGKLSTQEHSRLLECRSLRVKYETELETLKKVSQQETTDFDGMIAKAEERIIALKKQIADVSLYIGKRAELTFSQLKLNRVAISLYDVVKTTGEIKDVFRFTYNGRNYDRLSLSEKVRAGMEVSELLKRLTGRNYPVFVDNMESVDDLSNVHPTGQVIMSRCVKGADLSVQPMGQPHLQAA